MAYQWTAVPTARVTANEIGTTNKIAVDGISAANLRTKYPPAEAIAKINTMLDIGGKSVAIGGAYITDKMEAQDND